MYKATIFMVDQTTTTVEGPPEEMDGIIDWFYDRINHDARLRVVDSQRRVVVHIAKQHITKISVST